MTLKLNTKGEGQGAESSTEVPTGAGAHPTLCGSRAQGAQDGANTGGEATAAAMGALVQGGPRCPSTAAQHWSRGTRDICMLEKWSASAQRLVPGRGGP